VSGWQDGRTLWEKKLGEAGNSEAVWGGKVVAGIKDGRLLMFDLNSGWDSILLQLSFHGFIHRLADLGWS